MNRYICYNKKAPLSAITFFSSPSVLCNTKVGSRLRKEISKSSLQHLWIKKTEDAMTLKLDPHLIKRGHSFFSKKKKKFSIKPIINRLLTKNFFLPKTSYKSKELDD